MAWHGTARHGMVGRSGRIALALALLSDVEAVLLQGGRTDGRCWGGENGDEMQTVNVCVCV